MSKKKDPDVLSVSVSDDMAMGDAMGGFPQEGKKEAPPPQELGERMVPIHSKPGREVKQEDIERLMPEASVLYQLCYLPMGRYNNAHAMAHTQIDAKDPLNFFVTAGGEIIINPKISNHAKTTVDSEEACMSAPDEPVKTLQRYNVLDLEYQTLDKEHKLTAFTKTTLQGKNAKIIQHEVAHLRGHCIQDEKIDPTDCLDNLPAKP